MACWVRDVRQYKSVLLFCIALYAFSKSEIMIEEKCITVSCYCFIKQGVRPEAFEKVENQEVKEIIDGCTKTNINDR